MVVYMIRFKLCKIYVTEILSNTKSYMAYTSLVQRNKANVSYWLRRKSLYIFLKALIKILALISFGVSFQVLNATFLHQTGHN